MPGNYRRGRGRKPKPKGEIEKIKKDVQALKKHAKGVEMQKKDGVFTFNPDNATGSLVHLTEINDGDQIDERAGLSVYHKSTYIRGAIAKNASAAETRVRVLIVKQRTNSAPAFNGVLAGGGIDYPKSSKYPGLSQILFDKTYQLHTYKPSVNLFASTKSGFKVDFGGILGTDYSMNNVWMMVISDQSVNTPQLSGRWRVNYTDK